MLAAAVRAQQQGFHIFPVEPGEKTPVKTIPGRPYTLRWGDAATNDLNQIIEWWTRYTNANVGIAAKPSALLVVDLDVPKRPEALSGTPWAYVHDRHGPVPHGEDVLWEMCVRYGGDWDELKDTLQILTRSGGLHLYFWWPPNIVASQASPVPEFVDVRCNGGQYGGYVLGPGSVVEGSAYEVFIDKPIARCPAWLIELIREKPRVRLPFNQPARFTGGTSAKFDGLANAVRNAPHGNGNNTLLWAARAMCEDGASQQEAEDLLIPAHVDRGGKGGERQGRATIASAYRLQSAKG